MTAKSELTEFFNERFSEIDAYLELLQEIETAAQSGAPRIHGAATVISASQQKILYSSVYLQLYNLVEATISQCIAAVSEAAAGTTATWRAEDLNDQLRKEWVRAIARTHIILNPEHRLEKALDLCKHLIDRLPVGNLDIEKGGGGNWDDEAIEKISARVGCALTISQATRTAVKRPMRDDLGAMKLVRDRRNGLAHGKISFVDCAEGIAMVELRGVATATGAYLREAISSYAQYIDEFLFLDSTSRPAVAV
jgi:hypothetical protein